MDQGEGNGTPLQYSCLKNPMDGGAWWAAIYGVSKSQTRLHFHFSLSFNVEGNGNPLQCSCLKNPRDGGAWWAAVHGVTQSWTRLRWLSSSSRYGPDTVLLRTTPSGRLYHFRNGGRDAWGTCSKSHSLDMEGQGWELCLTLELRYEWLRSVLEQNMLWGHVLWPIGNLQCVV